MALPSQVLERLAPAFSRGVGLAAPALHPGPRVGAGLSLGRGDAGFFEELDHALPDGGLLRGGIVELAVMGASALATTVALRACRAAQQEGLEQGSYSAPWCAFIDASRTLYAPGVANAGVILERLLVVRPEPAALSRTALRLVESQAFAVVVIDTLGSVGSRLSLELGSWVRVVRRLALAVEGSSTAVLLLTDAEARRPVPLPVAQRIELCRPTPKALTLQVVKDRQGRMGGPRRVACEPNRAPAQVRKTA